MCLSIKADAPTIQLEAIIYNMNKNVLNGLSEK